MGIARSGWLLAGVMICSVQIPVVAAESPGGIPGAVLTSTNLHLLPQWQSVVERYRLERVHARKCDQAIEACGNRNWISWRARLQALEGLPVEDQLRGVNSYINAFEARADMENYGLQEYWSTPLEFLQRSGDDEDAAIIKYFMLRELGHPAEHLAVSELRDTLQSRNRSVLLYHAGGEVQVLAWDQDAILPLSHLRYSIPVYSVNENLYRLYLDQ